MRWQPEEVFLTVTLPPGHHRTGLKRRHVAHGTVTWTNLRGGSNHLHHAHPKAEIKLQKLRWPGKRGSSLTKCMLQPTSIIAFMQPRSAACLSSDRLTAFSYGEHRQGLSPWNRTQGGIFWLYTEVQGFQVEKQSSASQGSSRITSEIDARSLISEISRLGFSINCHSRAQLCHARSNY